MIKNEFFVLHNGVQIPKVGFGTWQITDRSECIKSVLWAIDSGYTHIDTAAAYKNEEYIRDALLMGKHKRESLFITSKLHATKKGYDVTIQEFNDTLSRLGTDYLDLYLIHAPRPWGDVSNFDYMPLNIESWKAMEDLYKAGKIKAIGVSNFNKDQLQQLINETEIMPMVNQIKVHIGSSNKDIKEYCDQKGILVEAYSPNASGKIFVNEDIQKVANKYKVSISQLANRWCIQYGTIPLPKSVHQDRIIENINLDFEISADDLKYLNNL